MKRYIMPAFLALCVTGNATESIKETNFKRIYSGLGLNYSVGKISVKNKSDDSTFGYTSKGVGINAVVGGGLLVHENIYVGGEISLGRSGSAFNGKTYTSDRGNNRAILKSNSKMTHNTSFHLGYAFDNLLAYAKAGYETHGSVKVTCENTGEESTVRRNSFVLGAGADFMVNKSVILRAEYGYNFGVKKDVYGAVTIGSPTHTWTLGTFYKF